MKAVVLMIVLALLAVLALVVWDLETCKVRGEEYLSHFQSVGGGIMIPVYTSDCLER